jgi:hypothetical protein
MDHVPGEFIITSPVRLDTGMKKRIVKLLQFGVERPRLTKEFVGTRFDAGSVQARGVIVDTIPENGVDMRNSVASSSLPLEIDRTFGQGTVWEQFAALRANDTGMEDDETDSDDE